MGVASAALICAAASPALTDERANRDALRGLHLENAPVRGGKRVALVIGNADYVNFPKLRNPVRDAEGVAEGLRKLGFDVDTRENVNGEEFLSALANLSEKAADADAVLFYYAGHGVEVNRTGYLLPTNFGPKDLRNLEFSIGITLEKASQALSRSKGPKIFIVDACRNDPMVKNFAVGEGVIVRDVGARAISTGDVAETRAAPDEAADAGMLVVYSTAAKQVAFDGAGTNGPFAQSLIRHMGELIPVTDMFLEVTADVDRETGHEQRSNLTSTLIRPYKLNLGVEDELAWDKIRYSERAEDFDAFLAQFPGSAHAPEAKYLSGLLHRLTAERGRSEDLANKENDAWTKATTDNTADAYQSFADQFPNSGRRAQALQRAEALRQAAKAEAQAWQAAIAANTADAFAGFLAHFPNSTHAPEATQRRDDLRRAMAEATDWEAAQRANSPESYGQFAERYPNSQHSAEALRRRGDLLTAERKTAERTAWAQAQHLNTPEGYDQFADKFADSEFAPDARRKAQDLRLAALAQKQKDDAAHADAEVCRQEQQQYLQALRPQADLLALEGLRAGSGCKTLWAALDRSIAEAMAVKEAAICTSDLDKIAKAGDNLDALRDAEARATCDKALKVAHDRIAREVAREQSESEAKEAELKRCDAARARLDAIDTYDQPAKANFDALRASSGCSDAGFQQQLTDRLALNKKQVLEAQQALARLKCYASAPSGVFDDALRKSLSAYVQKASGVAVPVAADLRVTPELVSKLEANVETGVCETTPTVTTVAPAGPKAGPVPARIGGLPPAKPPAGPKSGGRRGGVHNGGDGPVVEIQPRPPKVNRRGGGGDQPRPRPAAVPMAGPQIMIIPN